jgi:hypothetical protein
MRAKAIKTHYNKFNDILEVQKAHPLVKIRYNVIPQTRMETIFQVLSLEKKLITSMMDKGRDDGMRCIQENSNKLT